MLSVSILVLTSTSRFIQRADMSVFRKILGRKSTMPSPPDGMPVDDKNKVEGAEVSGIADNHRETPCHNKNLRRRRIKDHLYKPYLPDSEESDANECDLDIKTPPDSSCSTSSGSDIDELLFGNRFERMTSKLEKLRKQRDRLRHRQNDVISLEKEIRHIIALITNTKCQSAALKEDILAKKCELKFLATQVPEGYDLEAKKKEPVFYKKYSNIKSSNDAKNLLVSIRQKMRALQYVELLTYNKVLEYQHGLKRDHVKKAFGQMMQKGKGSQFDHVTDCFHPGIGNSQPVSPIKTNDDSTYFKLTTVTIEPLPVSSSTPEVTSTRPVTPPAPPLPRNGFNGPFTPLALRQETFI